MSRVKLDKDKILKKFKSLSMTALCIQKTSKYMYQFFKSSDSIVSIWHQALLSASDQSKIALFYIANEMLQSRYYGSTNFKQSWKPQLLHSVELIKNSPTIDKIVRMFNIWIERRVYDQSFIEELISKLSSARSPVVNEEDAKNIILNFEPEDAMDKLKNLIKIESELDETMKHIDVAALNFDEKSCKEAIKKLKDKAHCNEFSNQLDGTINQLFQICSLMEEELKVRKNTLKMMENAEIYYQTQLSETLIVEDAYKRYGNLISKTKDALEEHLDFLIDDSGPIDIDDAPSPGKTPPYLYEDTVKSVSQLRNSPMSFQDVVSPTQSMDMSEDDTPMDSSTYIDKPYSPSNEVESKCDTNVNTTTSNDETKTSLSCSDALKILTSVFTQSLTKKVTTEPEVRVHLQPDIFRNTLSTASTKNDLIDTSNNNNNNTSENSDSVVADAFRLISNLTGIKNISERNYKTETTTSSGTTIPILTSKNSYRNISNDAEKLKSNMFPYNQPNYPSVNISTKCDTISHSLFSDVQNSFPPAMFNPHSVSNNQIFPLLSNHSGLTTQPPPPLFNPISNNHLAFNIGVINKDNNQSARKSPGSCTEDEDEGGATPTQDEPIIHQNPTNIFNQNVIPVLHQSAEEINKQIQNVMNATNPFGIPNMLNATNDSSSNNSIQQSQWNLANQFPFNLNNSNVQQPMNMPFNLMNQNTPIQPSFSPVNNSKNTLNYGPPRAIRTKRPNPETCINQTNSNDMYNLSGSIDFSLTPPPPPPPKSDETVNVSQHEDQSNNQSENECKNNEKESELLNLYGDVEEEMERNYNFNQQNINVRSSRPPPPSDRYHLYNQATSQNMNYRFNDPHNNINRMNYQHPYNYRNQFPRGMHFPNRTTNFRPRHNYNMFN